MIRRSDVVLLLTKKNRMYLKIKRSALVFLERGPAKTVDVKGKSYHGGGVVPLTGG